MGSIPTNIQLFWSGNLIASRPLLSKRLTDEKVSMDTFLDETMREPLSLRPKRSGLCTQYIPPSTAARDKLELMLPLVVLFGVLTTSLQKPKESPPTWTSLKTTPLTIRSTLTRPRNETSGMTQLLRKVLFSRAKVQIPYITNK